MRKYTLDHSHIKFSTKVQPNFIKLNLSYLICKVDLENIYAQIATDSIRGGIKYRLVKLKNTPHYQYLQGNKQPYYDYLVKFGKNVGYGLEHSVKNFEKLIHSESAYLRQKYSSNYIICEKTKSIFSSKNVIIDGVHRASILLHLANTQIPVAFIQTRMLQKFEQLDQYIKDYKDDFLEWYTPLEIEGRIINERTYPHFIERPEFLHNKERGKSKWDYIIKNNLPSLKGKTICDIGCNIGLYSIYMTQMGAKKVSGFDRSETIIQPTNSNLPKQNVVQQAYFVKNLFLLTGQKNLNKIQYFERDINLIDFSKLKYDLLFSSCVLYHFGEKRFEEIIKNISSNIPEVFLQTNLGHKGELSEIASLKFQKSILEKYGYRVTVVAPNHYDYPILCGKKNK